jgi:hypothetical protein
MTAEPNHWADGMQNKITNVRGALLLLLYSVKERDIELMLSLAWRSCHVEKLSEAIHKNRIDDQYYNELKDNYCSEPESVNLLRSPGID